MPIKKITQFDPDTSPSSSDLVPTVKSGANKKVTISDFSKGINLDNISDTSGKVLISPSQEAEIATNTNKNTYPSADASKLAGIAIGAEVNAVDSVNGETGTVVLTTGDLTEDTNKNYVTDAEKTVIGNTTGTNTGDQDLSTLALKSNVLELNNTTSFTPNADYEPATKKYVDENGGAVASVNGETGVVVLDKTDIGLSNVDNTTDAGKPISTLTQTALDGKQVIMGSDDNYVTNAEKVIVGNTSGTNTGDQDLSTLATKANVLELDNTTSFTPDSDYEPATKKYVDDNSGGGGSGDQSELEAFIFMLSM